MDTYTWCDPPYASYPQSYPQQRIYDTSAENGLARLDSEPEPRRQGVLGGQGAEGARSHGTSRAHFNTRRYVGFHTFYGTGSKFPRSFVMDSPSPYLQKAQACADAAETARDPAERAALVQICKCYMLLAEYVATRREQGTAHRAHDQAALYADS